MKTKTITFTEAEDTFYGKRMGDYLNYGLTDLKAEKLTIIEMRAIFPRLKKLLVGKYKIFLEI